MSKVAFIMGGATSLEFKMPLEKYFLYGVGIDTLSRYGIVYFRRDAFASCLNSFSQEMGSEHFRTTGKLQFWVFTSCG